MNFECITTTTILFNYQSVEEENDNNRGEDGRNYCRGIIRGSYERKDDNIEIIKYNSHLSRSKATDAKSIKSSNHDDNKNHHSTTHNSSIKGHNATIHHHRHHDHLHHIDHHHTHHHHYHEVIEKSSPTTEHHYRSSMKLYQALIDDPQQLCHRAINIRPYV